MPTTKQILLFLVVVVFSFEMTAQRQNPWQKSSTAVLESQIKVKRTSLVTEFEVFSLDMATFRNQLSNAPKRGSLIGVSNHEVTFPDVDGTTKRYRIYEAPVMHPELQAQFSDIKSYVGVCLDNKSSVIRFSMTIFGLHAMILSPKGTVYIDPYTADLNNYMVYKKKNAISGSSFECLTSDTEIPDDTPVHFSPRNAYDIESNTGIFRTYRLGLACTVEYAQFHINLAGVAGGTVAERDAAVLSAMNVTMTRVNGLFERDMSLTMVIVPNNTNVIFFLPEKPDALTNSDGGALINEIQPIINAGIGTANYDIGHVFSTGGGGIAQLNSPCGTGKARGVTGQNNPIGDPFDVDYVAHEMGHQYGATHTQNNNCNRTGSTAVEPGSASTILGYAGICSPNVQNNSDDHFHAVSSVQMDSFVAGSGNCSVNISNNNSAPVIQPIPNYTVPRSTPLILPGNATDADGDALTYCWEQIDNQVSTQPPVASATGGPNFRSLSPQTSPDRYLPNLATVLTGVTANTWEVIPSVNRTMNFALTVRDNELINGGQTARANMTVTTNAAAGPFVVNSPNTNVSWLAGSNQTITWDVAGTTANGINTALVDIYLSTNGGTSFPVLVASNVPNDGSETITIPNNVGTQNRIMVRGDNHIFYDVSNTNFTIATSTPTFALAFNGQEDGQNKGVCQGQSVNFDMNYSTIGGFSGNTTFSVSGNPIGTTVVFSPSTISSSGIVQMTLSDTDIVAPGIYQMTVTGTSGSITKAVNLYVEVLNSTFQGISSIAPLDLATGVSNNSVVIEWSADPSATNYDFELASDVDFTTVLVSQNVTTNQYTATNLDENTNYFWRVLPKNSGCQGELSAVFRFTTGSGISCDPIVNSTNVPLTISASGTPTINSTLTIPTNQNQSIDKITVTLNITHTWVSDLTVTLISPTGTQVQLFSGQCGSADNAIATFDDDGITLTCQGTTPAITGTLIPAQALSALIGENTQGTWTLRVFDAFDQDGGSLNSWGITICTIEDTPLSCGDITSVWNGTTWSNGYPVNNVAAVINDDLVISSNLECCSVTINNTAQVVVESGNNLIVENEVSVAGTASLAIENNANLIQITNASNSGILTQFRNTNPLMRLDYVMWSSPVTGAQSLKDFSPFTMNNRFYNYITTTNIYSSVSNPLNLTWTKGVGYLIRMPDNHPTTPTNWTGEFEGEPNNGEIDIDLTYISGTQKYNAIGNPYPSTISAATFLQSNSASIEGTIYFWRKTNNAAGTAYATYTLGGATTTSPTSPVPNGTVQVGQGFIVAAQNVANPTAQFSNAMRVDNNSNQSFRSNFGLPFVTQSEMERHRIWLNLSNSNGFFSQMMVGYMSNATNEVDQLIDGKYIGDSQIALSSFVNNEEYVIQGKALPFEVSDVVPLVFRTNISGNFTISLSAVDGLFEGEQLIYLRDNLTGTVHNLKLNDYSFFTEIGVFASRFELLYENVTLGIENPELSNLVMVATGNQQIELQSFAEIIQKIQVFDVLGRTLYQNDAVQRQSFVIPGLRPENQALFLNIELNNGKQLTKKIIF
jgi:subtilisin-like proprotein convertase family protein